MQYHDLINEAGRTTDQGKALLQSTIVKGLNDFLTGAGKDLDQQQMNTIKAIVLSTISDTLFDRPKQ